MKNYHNLLFIFTLIFSIGCEDDKDDADDSALSEEEICVPMENKTCVPDDGFEQDRAGRAKLGDYNLGIGDSWVKAITEIITNSHQNYHQYWDKLDLDKEKGNPAIIIIADPHRETFTTIDLIAVEVASPFIVPLKLS